jgi:hypothetical protein
MCTKFKYDQLNFDGESESTGVDASSGFGSDPHALAYSANF